jgi:N-acetylglucosaminyl-diphospho-decaprenol L-rhamnosyltransferase
VTAPTAQISVSIVSHRQAALVGALLGDLARHCKPAQLEVLLTLNLPEPLSFDVASFPFSVALIHNRQPQGFAANHNQAFSRASGDYFCVLNPDIRLQADPFVPLLKALQQDATLGLAAPRVVGLDGRTEDSARRFPSPFSILQKTLRLGGRGASAIGNQSIYPDWAGGMFMLLPRTVFAGVQGFDSRYFLYYEDVDLCARMRLAGYRVLVTPEATVVHAARRDSHTKWRYLRWHLASMLRFFCSSVYWKVRA